LESNSFANQLLQSVFPCPSGRRALYLLKTAVMLRHEASLPTAGRCFIVCRFFVPQNDYVNDLLQFKKMPLQYGLGGKYRGIFNVSPGEMEKAKTLT